MSEILLKYMRVKAPSMETGMLVAMMMEERASLRKNQSKKKAIRAPKRAERATLSMEARMKSD